MKILFIVATSLLIVLQVHAVDIDKIFDAQKKSTAHTSSVDSDVVTSTDESNRRVAERYELIERARAEEMRRLTSDARASELSGGVKYSCSVTCTGSWWASGSNVNVVVIGGSEDQARESAAKEADPYCRKQKNSSGVFKNTALSSGSAKCEKQ